MITVKMNKVPALLYLWLVICNSELHYFFILLAKHHNTSYIQMYMMVDVHIMLVFYSTVLGTHGVNFQLA